jgi:hypothetical protein
MIQSSVPAYFHPLDILQRFAPAPYTSVSLFAGAILKSATNDRTLLPPFPDLEICGQDVEASITWKLLRDPTAQGSIEPPTSFVTETLSAIFMGPACLIAADRHRAQLFAFLGSQVDTRAYREHVLPVLVQLSRSCRALDTNARIDSSTSTHHNFGAAPAAEAFSERK